jgi:hypothetical protein
MMRYLIFFIISNQIVSIYGEKFILKNTKEKRKKKPQKFKKISTLKEVEKFFFYEERTDTYRWEIDKLMKKYNINFHFTEAQSKNFWFSFENNLYCKFCNRNFRQSIFKDDHFIKNHFFDIIKNNPVFFLDFEAEIRRFNFNHKTKDFRNLVCLDFFLKFGNFKDLKEKFKLEFCQTVVDVLDKHKLFIYKALFYLVFFILLFFILILYLVTTIEHFDPSTEKKYF